MLGPQDKQPEIKIEEEKVGVTPPTFLEGDLGEPEQIKIGHALGLENFTEIKQNSDQIQRLAQWAKMKGAKDLDDAVWQIKQLANRVGGPTIGNNWARHLSEYAYLEMERMEIDKKLRQMEPKN